jgi:nucleoside-diphosphate-sugar epimerase
MRLLDPVADWLRDARVPVIVTGAGGWLGRAALDMLAEALGKAFYAQVTAYAARERPIVLASGELVAARNFKDLADSTVGPALVLHFAFLTREYAGKLPPADYAAANRAISGAVLAFLQRNGAVGLLVPSSGAARDNDMTRNPYGALKCEDETAFTQAAARLGFPAAIIRVFNLAGPYINKLDSYALACVIADLRAGGPVRLRAAHPVWRSYTHVADVLNVGLGLIQRGASLPVFDTAGEIPVEIGDLAMRAAAVLGMPAVIERPDWQAGAADRYLGDFGGYRQAAALAGVKLQTLDWQIADTATYLAGLERAPLSPP